MQLLPQQIPLHLLQKLRKHQKETTSHRPPIGIKVEEAEEDEDEETKAEAKEEEITRGEAVGVAVEMVEEVMLRLLALLPIPVFHMVMFLDICQDLPVWWRSWRRGF